MGDVDLPARARAAPRPDRLGLFELGSKQGGYFIAEQARASGYSFALLSQHVKHGRFLRVRHGLYRLREYPSSPREDVLAAWLAAGKDVAVVSQESALDLLDPSKVMPDAVHLIMPRARRHLPTLPGVKIQTTVRPLKPSHLAYRGGLVLTSATRPVLSSTPPRPARRRTRSSWRCARWSSSAWPGPMDSVRVPPNAGDG